MCRHGQDIHNCCILPLTYDIEVIWQENSKSISQIDSSIFAEMYQKFKDISFYCELNAEMLIQEIQGH
jgi:hypothetical protein